MSVDESEFEQLFETNFESIFGYLARRVGRDVARDLAAETFAQAFGSRRRFDSRRGTRRAWLFGIAHNLVRHHLRDEERRLRAFARIERPSAVEPPPEEPRLAAALADLPIGDRDVLLLFAWADLSYDEIATTLSVPVGTVRSRLHRARHQLRDALTHEEAVDG